MRALVWSILAVALLMAFSSIGRAAKIEGLVLYYDFEEISGDKVVDKSGTGNDGTIKGTLKQVEGKYGKGLLFDLNTANYVDAGEPSFDELKGGGTIAAWIKPASLEGVLSVIDKDHGFSISVINRAAGGEWYKGGTIYSITGPTELQENEWSHLATTWDGETLKVYLDGKLENTLSEPTGWDPVGFPGPLTIGVTEGGQQPFDGVIDEVTIYDRPLTADEIQKVMEGILLSVESSGKLSITWVRLKKEKE